MKKKVCGSCGEDVILLRRADQNEWVPISWEYSYQVMSNGEEVFDPRRHLRHERQCSGVNREDKISHYNRRFEGIEANRTTPKGDYGNQRKPTKRFDFWRRFDVWYGGPENYRRWFNAPRNRVRSHSSRSSLSMDRRGPWYQIGRGPLPGNGYLAYLLSRMGQRAPSPVQVESQETSDWDEPIR